MNDKHCTFPVSLLAREKGFKMTSNPHGFITKFYHSNTGTEMSYGFTGRSKIEDLVYKPTQTELQKWLRDTHKIFVYVDFESYKPDIPRYLAKVESLHESNMGKRLITGFSLFTDYEDALEEGLYETLKFIK